MLKTPIFIADAFVGQLIGRELRGNPAAVVLLDAPRDAAWMQSVAQEMNLSETAFVVPREAEHFDLRWFTPSCEVELCGHATLASTHVLLEHGWLAGKATAHFHTLSGLLTAQKRGEEIELDFPAQRVEVRPLPPELRDALGLSWPEIKIETFHGGDDWFLELGLADFALVDPLFAELRQFCRRDGARGVIVTAKTEGTADFVSRFFGPAVGIDEDPVTGSAHTKLAPFWAERLRKREMLGFQDSKRGGLVRVACRGERVLLSGRVVTVLRGELLI